MHYTPVSLSSPITDSVTQINNHLFSVYRQPVLRKTVNLRVSLTSFNPSGGGNFKHVFTWLMIVKAKLNYAYENVKSHDETISFTHNSITLITLFQFVVLEDLIFESLSKSIRINKVMNLWVEFMIHFTYDAKQIPIQLEYTH